MRQIHSKVVTPTNPYPIKLIANAFNLGLKIEKEHCVWVEYTTTEVIDIQFTYVARLTAKYFYSNMAGTTIQEYIKKLANYGESL